MLIYERKGRKMYNFSLKHEFYKLISDSPITSFEKTIELFSPAGATAAFQLVVANDENIAISIGSSDWFSYNDNVTVFRVEYEGMFTCNMNILGYITDDDGKRKADILLKGDTEEFITVNGGVYCEINIPKSALSGDYEGKIKIYKKKMFEPEMLVETLSVKLYVGKYVLPNVSERNFHLDLWQHSSNIARHHDVSLWSDEHFAVLEKYVESLAALGQKAVTLVVSEIPWSGQSCFEQKRFESNLFEYSMVKTKKLGDNFYFDYSVMQRYIDLCKKYGISDEISVYGLANIWKRPEFGYDTVSENYPDAVRIRYYDENDGTYKYMTEAKDIDLFIKSLEQYFVMTDQMKAVRLCADEPGDVEAYKKSIDHLLAVAPAFKLKAAINHAEFIGEFKNEIFDFVPYIGCLSKEYDRVQEYKEIMTDKRFLWYVCCGPEYPNTFIKSPLRESAFIGILTSYMGLHGFLRWNYTVYNKDPRNDLRYGTFPAGDINFVYPAYNGSPLLSLRYKALKRGLDYYEMLETLKKLGATESLEKCYDLVIKEKDIRNYFSDNFGPSVMMCDDAGMDEFVKTLITSLDKITK